MGAEVERVCIMGGPSGSCASGDACGARNLEGSFLVYWRRCGVDVARSAQPRTSSPPLPLPSLSGSPTIPSDSTMGGWMPSFRLGSSGLAAVFAIGFAVALGILIQPGTSHAYTPEQQQACQPDAMRLCGEFVPNVDAITACMIQKKSQLSPQCRVFFRSGRGRARPPRRS
jgi:hypothetical protein